MIEQVINRRNMHLAYRQVVRKLRQWVVTLMAVQIADCCVSATIAAETVIALNAREHSVKNGYRQEKKSFCLSHTFIWSLHCLIPLTHCASISPLCSTTSCSKQHGVCLTVSVMTINGWV